MTDVNQEIEVGERYHRDRSFRLQELVTRQGYGCNEFVFVKAGG